MSKPSSTDAGQPLPAESAHRLSLPGQCWRGARLIGHFFVGLAVLAILPWRRHAGRLAGWWYRRFLRLLGVQLATAGQPPAGGTLVVSNHVSWLDIIVLGSLLDAAFVSKSEIAGWPLVGPFARATGTVFLPRGAGRTQEATAAVSGAMRAGRTVVLFPEATTNAALAPGRFHARLFAAAIETGTPVHPVALHYLPDNSEPGHHRLAPWVDKTPLPRHFWRLFRLTELSVRVTFCAAVPTQAGARRAVADNSQAAIARALTRTDAGADGAGV